MSDIDSIAGLEAILGKTPPAVNLKVIDHVDESAMRWLAAAPLMFAGFGDAHGIGITLAGGAPGFATAEPAMLSIPLAMLDDRSEEHTSELQSLMRTSYAVFCLK